jgi:hypothetical protein
MKLKEVQIGYRIALALAIDIVIVVLIPIIIFEIRRRSS